MAKTLVLKFKGEDGKVVNVNVTDIREDITEEEAKTLANTLLSKKEAINVRSKIESIVGADIVDRTTSELYRA